MDNGWDSRRPLLGCPFEPPSGVHSPAIPCSDLTVRNSLKGCSTGYFSPSQVCCNCFVVSYYNADFSVVKSLFPSFFARVSHSADFPVCFSRGGQFFVHLSKSTPERSRKYFRPLKQFCRVKKFVRGAYRTPNGFLTTDTAARPHRPPPAHTPSAAPSSTPVRRPPPRRQCRSPAVRHRP